MNTHAEEPMPVVFPFGAADAVTYLPPQAR
jgi:hypothetical protein